MGSYDSLPDNLRDFGRDGVTDGPKSVHSAGSNIIHSTKDGVSLLRSVLSLTQSVKVTPMLAVDPGRRLTVQFRVSFASTATGVGNNEHAVTDVRGTDGCSRYAVPLRVIPERGQVPENSSKEPSSFA